MQTRSTNTIHRSRLLTIAVLAGASGCATVTPTLDSDPDEQTTTIPKESIAATEDKLATQHSDAKGKLVLDSKHLAEASPSKQSKAVSSITPVSSLKITKKQRTGSLANRSLNEVSGLAASPTSKGVLFAINDSGNSANLFALDHTGKHLDEWTLDARNRDWEDMAFMMINNQPHLVVGDTGDNLRTHRENQLYVFAEPAPGKTVSEPLSPVMTVRYVYEDGPRNVEAFGIVENTAYLISKEPVSDEGPVASRLYELQLPDEQTERLLTARHIATLPQAKATLETRLAAAIAGVDLNHPTALDFDESGTTAYLLTYRHVLRVRRAASQTWAQAFSSKNTRIHAHNLEQAEALAVGRDNTIWFTSENRPAPLWAIPAAPPL